MVQYLHGTVYEYSEHPYGVVVPKITSVQEMPQYLREVDFTTRCPTSAKSFQEAADAKVKIVVLRAEKKWYTKDSLDKYIKQQTASGTHDIRTPDSQLSIEVPVSRLAQVNAYVHEIKHYLRYLMFLNILRLTLYHTQYSIQQRFFPERETNYYSCIGNFKSYVL
jgi:hypothetical protein